MEAALQQYAEAHAPRYTSYPTAPHFDASVDARVFAAWLAALEPQTPLSLYLHTPYCKEMCWYCGCNAYAARRDQPIAEFVAALAAEIDLVAAATAATRVADLHWGGGTPNILSPERFEALVSRLRERFRFAEDTRFAVELDPRLFTEAQARSFERAGVNRASIGVQDFDPAVQAAIGRVQPYEVVARSVALLREAGIGGISFDLMYGLPGQSSESVRRTALLAARLRPARLSVFGYAHVPWFKSRQKLMDAAALPGAAARLELSEAIAATLCGEGYVAIGYDHYALADDPIAIAARTGALARNFQGFVEAPTEALIGLGPSAISSLPQGYAQNHAEIGAWRGAIGANGFATKRGRALNNEDRMRRAMIMRLLCEFALDLGVFGGATAFPRELDALAQMARDGLVCIVDGRVEIPHHARPFARLVAQVFDAYRDVGEARHSRAV